MFLANLNFVTIIMATIINIVLGAFWYSEKGFGKTWMRLAGLTKPVNCSNQAMAKLYGGAIILNLIFSTAFSSIFNRYYVFSLSGALTVAVFVWLGLILPVLAGAVLWEGKPLKLLAIHAGYYLVTLLLMATIFNLF